MNIKMRIVCERCGNEMRSTGLEAEEYGPQPGGKPVVIELRMRCPTCDEQIEDLQDLLDGNGAPQPEELELARVALIEEMESHEMHAEDAASTVDGLIGVSQRHWTAAAQEKMRQVVVELQKEYDAQKERYKVVIGIGRPYIKGRMHAMDICLKEIREKGGVSW